METSSNKIRSLVWISLGAAGIALLPAAYAWIQLPPGSQIPTHWNVAGEVDGYAGKAVGLLLIPAMILGLTALFVATPRIDPKGDNILRSWEAYRIVWLGTLGVMLAVQFAVVATALGISLRIDSLIPAAVGLLLILFGSSMGNIRPYYMFGVRTPWTLTSELSWNKTHRLTGWLFIVIGVAMIAVALLNPGELWVWVMMAGIFGVLIVVFAYSYWIWKHDPTRQ